MSVDYKLDAEFGINLAGRSLISGAVERDWARSASGHLPTNQAAEGGQCERRLSYP